MRMLLLVFILCPSLFTAALSAQSAKSVSSEACGKLAGISLPNASISSAKAYDAGAFVGPPQPFAGGDLSAFYSKLPAFCVGSHSPSSSTLRTNNCAPTHLPFASTFRAKKIWSRKSRATSATIWST